MGIEVTEIKVIHKARFEDEKDQFVATVLVPTDTDPIEALEYAYRWTNNVEGSWSIKKKEFEGGRKNGDYNDFVKVVEPLEVIDGKEWGHRSTSSGDHMILNGDTYRVAMVGFQKIETQLTNKDFGLPEPKPTDPMNLKLKIVK
jgi:hypothetical protein